MVTKKTTTKKTVKKKLVKKAAPVHPALLEKGGVQVTIELEETPVVLKPEEGEKTNGNGKEKYFSAVGRRKESVARVRLFTKKSSDLSAGRQVTGEGEKALIVVNNKDYTQYFSDVNLQNVVESPLKKLKSLNRFKATVLVKGGGSRGQADAVKHGIARALVLFDINFRKKLKKSGLLTRDPRVKERRKYGHKKARKSGQFSKR